MDQPNRFDEASDKPGNNLAGKLLAKVCQGHGRTRISLDLFAQGRDLLLQVTGGQAHIGAVAVAGPANTDPEGYNDLITVPGHKEGPLAKYCAGQVAQNAQCHCAAVVGIHQDQVTKQEIDDIVEGVKVGLRVLIQKLNSDEDTDD